ncbi:ISL3 family transposase [Deinococcus ruber]|uniref:Transposase n=1 Tax=Deinococcus ruber TaxID=1848197 RepID=A0A918FCE8_9DEIO|nr:ISL3 family transposase [Deinococcus ruber]GGR26880.1 transposase [Deinococcus ruber]
MALDPEQVFGICGLKLDTAVFDDARQCWVIELRSMAAEPPCPTCGQLASRRHSAYWRTLADVPCAGHQTLWRLVVRRQFCQNATCSQRIFAERFPLLALPFARTTTRLIDVFRSLAVSAGGRGGARLALCLAMPVDRKKLLRIVRQTPPPAATSVRVLGIDDWAFRKGLTYGTILVDLEAHQIVDLLPDRRAESVAEWLREHPGVQIITRDRASVYADGARQGAPNAVQVADRWHLLKNLKDAVQATLLPWQTEVRQSLGGAGAPPADTETGTPRPPFAAAPEHLAPCLPIPEHTQLQFDRIQALRRAGSTLQTIATDVGRSRNTVRKYVALDTCPAPQRRARPSQLEPFKPYLMERFERGCDNARVLWEEVRLQGYAGGATMVRSFLAPFRGQGTPQAHCPPSRARPPSIRTLSCLLIQGPELRNVEEQCWVEQLTAMRSEAGTMVLLTQQFAAIVRRGEPQGLGTWLQAATESGIAALMSFAKGVWNDLAAVREGIVQAWSNGPVEGHINKLKTVKRQMYGRAKLDLLRARLLAGST